MSSRYVKIEKGAFIDELNLQISAIFAIFDHIFALIWVHKGAFFTTVPKTSFDNQKAPFGWSGAFSFSCQLVFIIWVHKRRLETHVISDHVCQVFVYFGGHFCVFLRIDSYYFKIGAFFI